uniref:B30.2/SPRY domain-containing protein n=1 Tax=Poecilia mexicana TaxID=48701 RepID=A0A3B3XD00_9TELE
MRKREAEVQEMIQERRLKIQEIRESVKISRDAADREKAEGVQVFSALMESAERGLKELLKEIQDKQETTEREAEDFIRELEQEISELKKRSSEVNFNQSFSSLGDDPPNKNWVEDRVHPPSYEGTVERAVAQLEEKMKKMLDMRRVQQFAVDVTLDPDTAHPKLILSDDRKQVKHGDDWKKLPDNPERFSKCVFVLAEQSFSSGRFYFEVQVKGKTEWDLGVVRESVDRKEILALSTKNGFWTLVLRNENRYSTGEKTSTLFDLHPGPEKVGVFVDYDQGLVSFYDVDAAALIYSFTGCCFKEKLYPFFSPYLNNGGKNSAPLIICPVSQAVQLVQKIDPKEPELVCEAERFWLEIVGLSSTDGSGSGTSLLERGQTYFHSGVAHSERLRAGSPISAPVCWGLQQRLYGGGGDGF